MATEDKEKEKKAALIIIPIGLGAFLLWWFTRRVDPNKAILYGLVTDAETEAAISDIDVNCDGYAGKTNANGEYVITNIPPGTYSVTFTDPYGRYQSAAV